MTEQTKDKKPQQQMKIAVKKTRKPMKTSHHSALERCRAVLSVWTERRRPSEVCRELDVRGQLLNLWQNRALEGMLQALEPRVNLEMGPALPGRLQKFLEKRTHSRQGNMPDTLSERLRKIQSAKTG
jgi:transposase-like protein